MGYCAALDCHNGTSGVYKNPSVSFYSFPLQNPALLRQWIQNMGRDMETPSKYQCLCSEHFEESSFEADPRQIRKKRRLRKEAVPNKFILGTDGTWLVGTPRAHSDVRSKKTQKRIRDAEPCRVPGMFPQWPRLEDWQNEFYKQLLKEKYGPWMALGKGCSVPKSQIPARGAARVKEPQDLEGRKIPASLSTGHGGAIPQGAGGTKPPGSTSGRSPGRAGTSGSRRHPKPTGSGSAPAARWWEVDEFRQFLLDHQSRPQEATVPWFICVQCGKSFARHAYLLRHQRAHGGRRVTPRHSPAPNPAPPAAALKEEPVF